MSELFANQDYGRKIYKHVTLPVYLTDEFRFYRCVSFKNDYYGKTVSELHNGNLRPCNLDNRYSILFPHKRTSYWSDSPQTARAELKYHNPGNNLLTFFAYDDATSSFPILSYDEPLIIIDGREIRFNDILLKIENKQSLTINEQEIINEIDKLSPDCLVFNSLRKKDGLNYIFFEKGFAKLSIREVKLRLGDMPGKNSSCIPCANTSDYAPIIESYGKCFLSLAKIRSCEDYLNSNEFKERYLMRQQRRGV